MISTSGRDVADVLRGLDYHVVTAPNAEAALDLLRSDKPVDLLLTDIIMPGWNGRELPIKQSGCDRGFASYS